MKKWNYSEISFVSICVGFFRPPADLWVFLFTQCNVPSGKQNSKCRGVYSLTILV